MRGTEEHAVTNRGLNPAAASRARWPYFGRAQKRLVFAGFATWFGAGLPWLIIPFFDVTRRAAPLTVAWVLWAGLMTLGAGIAPWRLAAIIGALGGGGTALYLALWQTGRIVDQCSFAAVKALDCFPGPGLLLTSVAGALALWQGWRILKPGGGGL